MGKEPLYDMRTAKYQVHQNLRSFAPVNSRPSENLSQRTRHVVSLRDRACALKDWSDGKSEEYFFYRDKAQM